MPEPNPKSTPRTDPLAWTLPGGSRGSLRHAYDDLVAANPLDPAVKSRALAHLLGGPDRLDQVLRSLPGGATGLPPAGDDLSAEERLFLEILNGMPSDRPAPAASLRRMRRAMGHRFDAYVDLMAFAAPARVMLHGRLETEAVADEDAAGVAL